MEKKMEVKVVMRYRGCIVPHQGNDKKYYAIYSFPVYIRDRNDKVRLFNSFEAAENFIKNNLTT